MPHSALAQTGASPKNPGALSALRMLAAAVGTVLACAACQPDTGSKEAGAKAAAEGAPAPAGPGQVPDGATLDLKPQIIDTTISTDAGGAKMALERKASSVTLTMPRAGTSRAQLTAVLDPGDYDVHLQLGAVEVQDRARDGFGAFFGPDNDRAASIELKPNSDQHVRITVPAKKQAYFSLGFGGWGKARGTMEIRTLEVTKAPKAPKA
ncbi:MAG: hypothetical protein JWP60_1250 [Ramlibacter sp.]|nr:hypothetical protein [Ramlibacter sp.]